MRETDSHVYFWGSFLSNFAWAPFVVSFYEEGSDPSTSRKIPVRFHTSEQYYMFMKAVTFEDGDAMMAILEAPDAKSAKAEGRKVKNFDEQRWYDMSYEVMVDALRLKFSQNPDFLQQLFNTGNKTLVEASPTDKIWGVGLHEDDDAILNEENWTGENRLGMALMQVRDEFRKKIIQSNPNIN